MISFSDLSPKWINYMTRTLGMCAMRFLWLQLSMGQAQEGEYWKNNMGGTGGFMLWDIPVVGIYQIQGLAKPE